jgi:hypothetical protein
MAPIDEAHAQWRVVRIEIIEYAADLQSGGGCEPSTRTTHRNLDTAQERFTRPCFLSPP